MMDEPVEPGVMLTLEINLPQEVSKLPILVVTQVVRCIPQGKNKFLVGVKSIKISKEENNLIVTYASTHLQRS